jgi:hypothetical protein
MTPRSSTPGTGFRNMARSIPIGYEPSRRQFANALGTIGTCSRDRDAVEGHRTLDVVVKRPRPFERDINRAFFHWELFLRAPCGCRTRDRGLRWKTDDSQRAIERRYELTAELLDGEAIRVAIEGERKGPVSFAHYRVAVEPSTP